MSPWIYVIVALLAVAGGIYYMEKHKKTEPNLWPAIDVPGLGAVSVTKKITLGEAQELAASLRTVQTKTFRTCFFHYGITKPWIVDKVAVVDGDVEKDHPHVVWHTGAHRITLKLQTTTNYWFARECHNVFRYQIEDGTKEQFDKVEDWITDFYT